MKKIIVDETNNRCYIIQEIEAPRGIRNKGKTKANEVIITMMRLDKFLKTKWAKEIGYAKKSN